MNLDRREFIKGAAPFVVAPLGEQQKQQEQTPKTQEKEEPKWDIDLTKESAGLTLGKTRIYLSKDKIDEVEVKKFFLHEDNYNGTLTYNPTNGKRAYESFMKIPVEFAEGQIQITEDAAYRQPSGLLKKLIMDLAKQYPKEFGWIKELL